MNLKEIFKEVYPLEEYKELKKDNPICFWLTILIPLLLLFAFFYLYFYPFGYSKEYIITQDNILEEKGDLSFSQGQKETDGLLLVTIDPKLSVRNLFGDLSVEGDDVHILHPTLEGGQFLDIWDYSTEELEVKKLYKGDTTKEEDVQFGEFKYATIDDYEVLDRDILSFYLRWSPKFSVVDGKPLSMDNQLLLKYQNLRIIQHSSSVEIRVDEVYGGNLYTYNTITPIDTNLENKLIAIYKKPKGSLNGYIELVVNNTRTGRVVVSSPYNLFTDYDDLKKYEEPLNEELIKDLSQKKISLGQELYKVGIEKTFSRELAKAVILDWYYKEKYKTPLLKDKDETYMPSLSEYYHKPFYNYFRGTIYEIKVGYEYPFETIQEHQLFLGDTPVTFSVAGNTENIEKITIKTSRNPLWEKFLKF